MLFHGTHTCTQQIIHDWDSDLSRSLFQRVSTECGVESEVQLEIYGAFHFILLHQGAWVKTWSSLVRFQVAWKKFSDARSQKLGQFRDHSHQGQI